MKDIGLQPYIRRELRCLICLIMHIKMMLFKLCDKAGIDRFSMHVLRHTFVTRCIEAGMKPKTLQTILGHSNIGITMNLYVHTTEEQKHKEIDLVADALKVI